MRQTPCRSCKDRFPACSTTCNKPEYLAWKTKQEERKAKIKKARDKDLLTKSYLINAKIRMKKSRCKKHQLQKRNRNEVI